MDCCCVDVVCGQHWPSLAWLVQRSTPVTSYLNADGVELQLLGEFDGERRHGGCYVNGSTASITSGRSSLGMLLRTLPATWPRRVDARANNTRLYKQAGGKGMKEGRYGVTDEVGSGGVRGGGGVGGGGDRSKEAPQ